VSSAIYYADMGMKTKENFFKGFPVVWNMVVFTLFVIEPGEWVSFDRRGRIGITDLPADQLPASGAGGAPPRNINLAVFIPLGLSCQRLLRCFKHFDSPDWVVWGVVATGIYLYCIGARAADIPQPRTQGLR
jgi:phosphatidylcholine synthase